MFENEATLAQALRETGVVDTHYHIGPELVIRRYNVKTLVDVATPFGATLVLKNHTYPTTPLASLARSEFGANFYGGVVLNNYVGGLNPDAVLSAVSGNRTKVDDPKTDPAPIVVWMPTVHSAAEIANRHDGFGPEWSGCCMHDEKPDPNAPRPAPVVAFDDGLRATKELTETLEAIAKHDCILATGHLCSREIMRLVPMALEMGIKKIVLTHPHYAVVGLSDARQAELRKHPEVFIEHCFAVHTHNGVPLEVFAEAIKTTGPEQVLLSTDFGKVENDPFPEGTIRFASELWRKIKGFVSEQDYLAMFGDNGRRCLGL